MLITVRPGNNTTDTLKDNFNNHILSAESPFEGQFIERQRQINEYRIYSLLPRFRKLTNKFHSFRSSGTSQIRQDRPIYYYYFILTSGHSPWETRER